jgi:hypothetical protein
VAENISEVRFLYKKSSRCAHSYTSYKPALAELAFSDIEKENDRDSKLPKIYKNYYYVKL